jgi:hypothetical protein
MKHTGLKNTYIFKVKINVFEIILTKFASYLFAISLIIVFFAALAAIYVNIPKYVCLQTFCRVLYVFISWYLWMELNLRNWYSHILLKQNDTRFLKRICYLFRKVYFHKLLTCIAKIKIKKPTRTIVPVNYDRVSHFIHIWIKENDG